MRISTVEGPQVAGHIRNCLLPTLQLPFGMLQILVLAFLTCTQASQLMADDNDSKSETRVVCQRMLDQATESAEKGELNVAVTQANEAVVYAKKEFGEADALFVSCLRQLASVNSKQGDHAKAIELEKRCLALLRKLHGGNHPDVAQSLGDLGTLYLTLGRYREANDHLQEAFEIASKTLDEDDPMVLKIVSAVAKLFALTGQNEQSEDLQRRIISVRIEKHGVAAPETVKAILELCDLKVNMNEVEEAERTLSDALEQLTEVLGKENLLVGQISAKLADLNRQLDNLHRAVALYEDAIAIAKQSLAADNPMEPFLRQQLAVTYFDMGQLDKAEPLFKSSLTDLQRILGDNHVETCLNLSGLALIHREKADLDQAEKFARRNLEIRQKQFGKEHFECSLANNTLGLVFYSQMKFSDAEDCFRRALRAWDKAGIPNASQYATTADNLIQLLTETNQRGEAAMVKAIARDKLSPKMRIPNQAAIESEAQQAAQDAVRDFQRSLLNR